jgi:hypothetical protein
MSEKLFLPLVAAILLTACGGVSLAPSPIVSCESRGCDHAEEAAATSLDCPADRVLVRDLGVDRYRGTGCGRTVALDCSDDCRAIEAATEITPRAEVAYRAAFELLCAPAAVDIVEEGDAFVASCRGIGVRYACAPDSGCARLGPIDEARYLLRQLEPAALDCLSRSRADLRVSFDSRGHVVRVDAEGIRPVRMRGFQRDRETAETKQECIRELFGPFPAFPELAATDVVFAVGGPGARRPSQLSTLAPPAALETEPTSPVPPPEPAPAPAEPEPAATASSERLAAEAELRAALDARSGAILACTGTPSAVLELRAEADGPMTLALRGALAGSPEEGCVRSAVGPLERPGGFGAGVLVHLVGAPTTPTP